MRRFKQDYLIIGFAIILLLIVLSLLYLTTEKTKKERGVTPTPDIQRITSVPEEINTERPPLIYSKTQQDKMMDYIQNRRSLSDNDIIAKANILSLLPKDQQSGIVMESNNIKIEYVSTANVFQVEILTTDIQAAKNEANIWLRTKGLSQKGICELPVTFYLNFEVANTIREQKIIFDPLGNGC